MVQGLGFGYGLGLDFSESYGWAGGGFRGPADLSGGLRPMSSRKTRAGGLQQLRVSILPNTALHDTA